MAEKTKDKRECRLVIVTGRKRIGKSNETLRQAFYEYTQNNPNQKGRKFLIFDTNNEYSNYEVFSGKSSKHFKVKRIAHKDVAKFSLQTKVEVARVIPVTDDGKIMEYEEIEESLLNILKNFRGGCLLLEDLSNTIGDSLPVRFSGALTNNAHRDCDIIIHLQSVGRILPKITQNTDFIRFHYQFDSIDDSKEKLKSQYEIFKICQLIVNKQYLSGNKRYFLYIDKDEHKLRGNYTKQMLHDAVSEYLSINQRALKPILDKRNASGKKENSYDIALNIKIKELVELYWGG